MILPLLSFVFAIILILGVITLYLDWELLKQYTFLKSLKNNLFFLGGIICLVTTLSLGIVGYYGLSDSWLAGAELRQLRLDLLVIGIILLAIGFRRQIARFFRYLWHLPWLRSLQKYSYRHRSFLLISVLFGFIALALMAPMASSRVIFSLNDHTSHIGYIVQAKLALEEGQFPLRVAPLENFAMRYPGFQFYSQLPYTLGGLIYKFLTPTNPYSAYKILLWLALWCGGIFIYRIGNWLTRSPIASMLGGIAYMAAPYFLNNIHARGAFTEAIAQGILPIALFYSFQVFYYPKLWRLLLSALAWFCLATTHIITFVYSSLFLIILGSIFWFNQKPQPHWRSLLPVALSYGWGWGLGLYFLAPVVLASKTLAIRKQIEVINPFDTNWMTPLANLISPASMPAAPTELGIAPTYGLHPAIGWIFLAAFGTVIYYRFNQQSQPNTLFSSRPWITPLLSIFLLSVFLTWSPLNIWSLLPNQLWVTQFTFRFLTHVMWSGALLTTIAILLIFRHRLEGRHLIIGTLIIVLVSRPWLPIPRGTVTVDDLLKEPYFRYSGALDYLYRSADNSLHGNAALRLSDAGWIPGYSTWDVFINRPLVFDVETRYPRWSGAASPQLTLRGEVPMETIQGEGKIQVLVDDRPIAAIPLTQKELAATIPLPNLAQSDDPFRLKFTFEGTTLDGKPPYIRLQHFAFSGLPPAQTLLSVEQTREACQQKGPVTHCTIVMDGQADIVQLPVFYYPNLQKIWVDGQRVTGFPTSFWDTNLLGLALGQGTHAVRIKFVGLAWANWVSGLAWLMLFGLTLWENLQTLPRHKNRQG